MGLKRFDYKLPGEKKNYKQVALVLCICMIAVLSFTSYALYQVQDKKDIVNSKVGEFNTSDVSLAILIDGVKSKEFPEKNSGKKFQKLECTNGGFADWDEANWQLSVKGVTGPTECIAYFGDGDNAAVKLMTLAKANTSEIFTDDTEDANIRYMGANPANYVDLGNGYYSEDVYYGYYSTTNHSGYREYTTLAECQSASSYNIDCEKIHSKGDPILWRVIGVMNNVDDGTGKKETRLKVIRDESIGIIPLDGTCMEWENADTKECKFNKIASSKDWNYTLLQKALNQAYYNGVKSAFSIYGTYSSYSSYEERYLDFSNNGLTEEQRSLITDAVFYLGGASNASTSEYYFPIATSSIYYKAERNNNNGVSKLTWTGKVGLMYASDYGYATSGGSTKDKAACAAKELFRWDATDYKDCNENNWLQKESWTLTPSEYQANMIVNMGITNPPSNYYGTNVNPVLYLKSDVKILSGNGTKSNPYKLGI